MARLKPVFQDSNENIRLTADERESAKHHAAALVLSNNCDAGETGWRASFIQA
jgi:hypothetical protein